MIKQLYTLLFCLFAAVSISCSGENGNEPQLPDKPDNETPGGNGEIDYSKVDLEYDDGTNCIFHVKIAIDKEGWEMKDEEFFKTRLKTQWEKINERFNKLDKKNELKRNYIFVPDLEDIIVYENDADKSSHWNVHKKYAERVDFNKYQCMVSYDFVIQDFEIGKGGGCGDDGKGMSVILVINPGEANLNKFYDHLSESTNTVAAITHELGHFRGIWDLYVVNFSGDKNPINGQGFQAPRGVMNNNTYEPLEKCEWNEYELLCLNANLAKKKDRLYDECLWEYFTDNIEINITEKGTPVNRYIINIYKYGSGEINPEVFQTKSSGGSTLRMDARELFWHGTAKWQWYSMFLLEAVNPDTGHKGYSFLPYYEPHTQGLKDKSANPIEGKSTYKITIDIK